MLRMLESCKETDLSLSFVERIGLLHECLENILPELKPSVCVIEDAFGNNARSALKLGQARGALISAVVKKESRLSRFLRRR